MPEHATAEEEAAPLPRAEDLTPGARQILDVASQLFYDQGIHAVGVDTIAAESGVTKRTLYNNFESKERLVAVYLMHRHQWWWQRLHDRLIEAPRPRALTVFDVYAEDARTVRRGCAYLNAAAELPTEHPGFAVIQMHKQALVELLDELVQEDLPDVPDPRRLARHLFLLLEGAFAHQGIHGVHLLTEAREIARDLIS